MHQIVKVYWNYGPRGLNIDHTVVLLDKGKLSLLHIRPFAGPPRNGLYNELPILVKTQALLILNDLYIFIASRPTCNLGLQCTHFPQQNLDLRLMCSCCQFQFSFLYLNERLLIHY